MNLFCLFWAVFIAFIICVDLTSSLRDDDDEVYDPYTTSDPKKRDPSPCEVCKFFITELQSRLEESANSKKVIEIGHGLDTKKKRIPYVTSELRLTEALHEPHICENILTYNVHAEREGSLRYAKGTSETMQTLHGLVDKGVKVEMDIPYDLWDKPSAEITKMHRACFHLAEEFEEDIEDWYYGGLKEDIGQYLCVEKYLPKFPDGRFDKNCLTHQPKLDDKSSDEEEKPKKKKKKGKKKQKGDSGDKKGSKNDEL